MGTAVSIRDVVDAFETAPDEASSFVNRATGDVLTVLQEHLDLAEDDSPREMADWEQEMVAEAKGILESDDWIELPTKFERHEWKILDEFGRSLPTESERMAIADAIHRSGAFQNFKATVRRLGIEPAWFAYKTRALETIARDWLTHNGFECLDAPMRP